MKKIDLKIKLNNGIEIPQIGYGSYKVTDPKTGYEAIKEAINYGYLMIDTAEIYGNHKIIARAIKDSNKEREELFLTSKIWNTHQTTEKTIKSFNQMLKDLDTDYLDLVLVHWPAKNGIECYLTLEKLYEEGKIKSLGVSNFLVSDLKELLKVAKYVPVLNQIEMHPLLVQNELWQFCRDNKIAIESWRTMMNGEADKIPYLAELAKKYNVDSGSICLQWAVQQQVIVIPKSERKSRIESNVDNLDKFSLTKTEIQKINKLGPTKRLGPDPKTFDR